MFVQNVTTPFFLSPRIYNYYYYILLLSGMTATQRHIVRSGQGLRSSKLLCMRMCGIGDTQVIRSYS